jgi:myo-inositol 2-dehydrogenase/D-chiro-inositol 1-dehydrogenase
MNFALLGDDSRILPLLDAIRSNPIHAVTHVLGVAPNLDAGRLVSGARSVGAWEELLAKDGPHAVILAGDGDKLLSAARRLLGGGKPLFVLPCLGQAASFVYELTLDQADSGIVLAPIFPLRSHPLVTKLVRLASSGELGPLLHLQLERRLIPTRTGMRLLTAEQLESAFLADADLLRLVGGEYDQVTSLRSGDPANGFSLASVTLAGAERPQAVWSASVASAAEPSWKLTVAGERSTIVLSGDSDRQMLTLELRAADGTTSTESTAANAGRELLSIIEAAVATGQSPLAWSDVTRVFDWLDATRRSLRRRRTIELHFEELSERSQFKSQMTAIGCGVLSFTLVAMVLYLMVAQMFTFNDTIKNVLRFAIFAPLGLFLLAQLLLAVTRSGKPE